MSPTASAALQYQHPLKVVYNDVSIDVALLKKAALVIRALKHPLRQKILQLLHRQGKMTVTELFVKLRLEQSVVSQQLAILRKTKFVLTERMGKHIFYSVHYKRLNEFQKLTGQLLS